MRSFLIRAAAVAVAIVCALGTVVQAAPRADAVSASDWDAGNIISDDLFFAANSMSANDVQAFFNAKEPNCVGANGYTCLRYYVTSTFDRPATAQCGAYSGNAAGESAAQILWKVSQACGISPKVLIVLIEKEQALVSASSPTSWQYRATTGYGCPDTAPCDAQYFGYYNQVWRAAWQFKEYTIHPASWRYRVGNTAVQLNPNAACGAPVVNIRNQATANLYNYTPYQPNAAALANLGGLGDACSSYGNRNFWVFYNNWFGPTAASGNPVGFVELLQAQPGKIRIGGWAFDPDTTDPVGVHVYINGQGTPLTASNPRPDIGAAYPSVGSNHGFDVTLPMVGDAPQQVCVYAINLGRGTNQLLVCDTLPSWTGAPRGAIEGVSALAGKVSVSGWAFDPDTTNSIPVHVYVDGVGQAFTADQTRSDVGSAYPLFGANHGYSATVNASAGAHNVCVYGINVAGPGPNTLLGCRTVTVYAGAPMGMVDGVTAAPGELSVYGWAFDPDQTDPIAVHVYVDGVGQAIRADQQRTDVGRAYAGYGDNHGYSTTIQAAAGTHSVCVYAIDGSGAGPNPSIGCRTVSVPGGSPIGNFEGLTAANGTIDVSGWALDPDTKSPIPVHIYVDGVGRAYVADKPRGDIGGVFPAYGPNHGFGESISASPGDHTVCVYGINAGVGANVFYGCRNVRL
jgi:hypothetical protein